MDGIKNRFIIIDSRSEEINLTKEQVKFLSDESNTDTGGCDQLVLIKNSDKADCSIKIYNSDGCEVDACGNVSRCIGWLLSNEKSQNRISIETISGVIYSTKVGVNRIKVDMGTPKFEWKDIPLSINCDTISVPFEIKYNEIDTLKNPVAVNVGNPHIIFFLDDIEKIDFIKDNLGSKIENHEFFPDRINIGIAQIIDKNNIKLRVFERGSGETLACGTGACAATISAVRKELTNRKVNVELKGGTLEIEWDSNNHIYMTGDINFDREGKIEL